MGFDQDASFVLNNPLAALQSTFLHLVGILQGASLAIFSLRTAARQGMHAVSLSPRLRSLRKLEAQSIEDLRAECRQEWRDFSPTCSRRLAGAAGRGLGVLISSGQPGDGGWEKRHEGGRIKICQAD